MKLWLPIFALATGLFGCSTDDGGVGAGPGSGYLVGEQVDVDGDGRAEGVAVDSNGDRVADALDTNGDGRGDFALPPKRAPVAPAADAGAASVDSSVFIPPVSDASVPPVGIPVPDGSCAAIEKEAELIRSPVDIIIALDTSLSMAPQICNVSTNLTKFANNVGATTHVVAVYEMGLLGIATLAACGNEDPLAMTMLATDANRYLKSAAPVDSHDGLDVLLRQFDSYKPFLRPNAPTHFIMVSDDESFPMLAADFKSQMEAKMGHNFFFHAIVADGASGCLGFGVGTQYLTLADLTMGQKLSMCEQDWSMLFQKLETAVVASAPLPCDFEVPAPPAGEIFDKNAVSVVFGASGAAAAPFPRATTKDMCGSNAAWHYDSPDQPKRIELCTEACNKVRAGGKISIAFGCAPPILL